MLGAGCDSDKIDYVKCAEAEKQVQAKPKPPLPPIPSPAVTKLAEEVAAARGEQARQEVKLVESLNLMVAGQATRLEHLKPQLLS